MPHQAGPSCAVGKTVYSANETAHHRRSEKLIVNDERLETRYFFWHHRPFNRLARLASARPAFRSVKSAVSSPVPPIAQPLRPAKLRITVFRVARHSRLASFRQIRTIHPSLGSLRKNGCPIQPLLWRRLASFRISDRLRSRLCISFRKMRCFFAFSWASGTTCYPTSTMRRHTIRLLSADATTRSRKQTLDRLIFYIRLRSCRPTFTPACGRSFVFYAAWLMYAGL